MKEMMMNCQSVPANAKGHRQRLKERLLKEPESAIETHHLLEILLFYVIPVRDTRKEAVALLQKFCVLKRIFYASPRELLQIHGIGNTTADLFQCVLPFLPETEELSDSSEIVDIPVPDLPYYDSIPNLLTDLLKNDDEGTYCIALFDVQMNLLFLKKQTIRTYRHEYTPENLRHLLEVLSVCQNVSNAILIHKHSQSVLSEDEADGQTVAKLSQYLRDIRICLQYACICNAEEWKRL